MLVVGILALDCESSLLFCSEITFPPRYQKLLNNHTALMYATFVSTNLADFWLLLLTHISSVAILAIFVSLRINLGLIKSELQDLIENSKIYEFESFSVWKKKYQSFAQFVGQLDGFMGPFLGFIILHSAVGILIVLYTSIEQCHGFAFACRWAFKFVLPLCCVMCPAISINNQVSDRTQLERNMDSERFSRRKIAFRCQSFDNLHRKKSELVFVLFRQIPCRAPSQTRIPLDCLVISFNKLVCNLNICPFLLTNFSSFYTNPFITTLVFPVCPPQALQKLTTFLKTKLLSLLGISFSPFLLHMVDILFFAPGLLHVEIQQSPVCFSAAGLFSLDLQSFRTVGVSGE